MAIYGAIFAAMAQLCWFSSIRSARPAEISLAGAFSPAAGIVFALVILGETPTRALAAGDAIILVGIAIGQFGHHASQQPPTAGSKPGCEPSLFGLDRGSRDRRVKRSAMPLAAK